MKKECRKCGSIIPNKIKVNGKEHHLNNRKFCLKCSPFMMGNRDAVNPQDPKTRPPRTWSNSSEDRKEMIKCCLYKRGLERKVKLLELKGGKCSKCGYDKSKRALTFHHRDKSLKLFGLSLNNLWSKSMEVLLEEAEKCDVLCMNCHMEHHNETDANIVSRVNKKYGTNF